MLLPECTLKSRKFNILNKCLTLIKRTQSQVPERGEGRSCKRDWNIRYLLLFSSEFKNEITSSLTDSWKIVSMEYSTMG